MFFVSLFWAYFHSSLSPTPAIGCMWPPKGIQPINPAGLPAVNTAILLLSGVTITKAHKLISTCRIFPRNLGIDEYADNCFCQNYTKPNYLNQMRLLRILLRVQSLRAKTDFEDVVKPKATEQGFNLGEYYFIVTEESLVRLKNLLNALL
jgi:hypothetical protein